MVRYYRRRYRRYKKYRRFYRRFGRAFGKYTRKYVNGSTRSQVRVKCTQQVVTTLTTDYPNGNTPIKRIEPLARADLARTEWYLYGIPLFRHYCDLYDEMKIIGCKINISVITPIGTSTHPALTFHCCWDRHCYDKEPLPTKDDIIRAATHTQTVAVNNNVAKITRSLYASDLLENATWIQTKYGVTNHPDPATNPNYYYNIAYEAASANFSAFHPAFIWYCTLENEPAQSTITFSVSVVYYVAFRGPKFGQAAQAANAAKIVAIPDDGGDMNDDGDADASGDVDDVPVDALLDQAKSVGNVVTSKAAQMSREHMQSMRSSPIVVRPRKN